MSLIRVPNISDPTLAPGELSQRTVLVLATGAGLGAASIYYSQPMLGVLATDNGASTQTLGLVPTLTHMGYALGILFTAPLGDRHDRRTLILIKVALLVASLAAAALSPSVTPLLVATPPRGRARPCGRQGDGGPVAGHPAVARGERLRARTRGLARHLSRRGAGHGRA